MWTPEKEGQEGDMKKEDRKFWLGKLQKLCPLCRKDKLYKGRSTAGDT